MRRNRCSAGRRAHADAKNTSGPGLVTSNIEMTTTTRRGPVAITWLFTIRCPVRGW
jgi:hypothetical protein